MKRTYIAIIGGVVIGGVGMVNAVQALTYQDNKTVDVQFTFNPTLTMSLDGTSVSVADVVPGGNTATGETPVNVTVKTNNVYGYTLSATIQDSTSRLKSSAYSASASTTYLASAGTSATSIGAGQWGYTTDKSNYSGLAYGTDKTLNSSTGATATTGAKTSFYLAAKAATAQVAGDYTGTIVFKAVTNPTAQ